MSAGVALPVGLADVSIWMVFRSSGWHRDADDLHSFWVARGATNDLHILIPHRYRPVRPAMPIYRAGSNMTYDKDNPPLTGNEVWRPWAEVFAERVAAHKANRQLVLAHGDSINNRHLLLAYGGPCGCFHCLRTFDASDVTEWVDQNKSTALCPHCHIDAVLPRTDSAFLARMQVFWFGQTYRVRLPDAAETESAAKSANDSNDHSRGSG